MRTFIFITLLSFFSVQLFAGEGNTSAYKEKHGALTVSIDGLASENGNLKIALFDGETGFPNQDWQAVYSIEQNIATQGTSIVFESIPYGDYAIYVYHDENSNGQLDKNWAGVPRESFTYSNRNNAKRTIPLYSQSVFSFEEDGLQLNLELAPVK